MGPYPCVIATTLIRRHTENAFTQRASHRMHERPHAPKRRPWDRDCPPDFGAALGSTREGSFGWMREEMSLRLCRLELPELFACNLVPVRSRAYASSFLEMVERAIPGGSTGTLDEVRHPGRFIFGARSVIYQIDLKTCPISRTFDLRVMSGIRSKTARH